MSDSRIQQTEVSVDRLVRNRELGSGGEGTVWAVSNLVINKKWPIAYKEYKPGSRSRLRADVLRAMVDYLPRQPEATAEWLSEHMSWPAMLVSDADGVCGYLMREIPERFFIRPGAGADAMAAGFEFLLNPDKYLQRIGVAISPRQRFQLLLDFARTLDRLDDMDVVLRDLSPKNVLFSLRETPDCFLIDCDSMALGNRGALPPTQTGGWSLPAGEGTETSEGVVYKFALLAVRLFSGSQDGVDVSVLRSADDAVADLAERGLSENPAARPTMAQWLVPLASAVETAPAVLAPGAVPQAPTAEPPGYVPSGAPVNQPPPQPPLSPQTPKGRFRRWAFTLAAVAVFGAWALDVGPFADGSGGAGGGTVAESSAGAGELGSSSPDSGSGSGSGSGTDSGAGSREEQATALDALVRENDGNRGGVASAVGKLMKCPGSGEREAVVRVFDEAAEERDRLVRELGELSVDELPSRVTEDLRSGWEASAAADRSYSGLTSGLGGDCTGEQVTSSAAWGEAGEHNARATRAKKDFVAGWNPVAEEYGLRTLAWDQV